MNYYTSTCRNCGEDCDGEFCSWDCQEDYEDGLGDWLYEQYRESRWEMAGEAL